MIDWRARATAIGAQLGIPYFAKQIEAESGFDPNAISPAGAEGIAQFMPATATSHGINPWDPEAALQGAARLDLALKKKYGHDDLVLAAYNAGEGAVDQYGGVPPFPETRSYIARILGAGVRDVQPIGSAPAGDTGQGTDCGLDGLSLLIVADRIRRGEDPESIAADMTARLGRSITVACFRSSFLDPTKNPIPDASGVPVLGGAAKIITSAASGDLTGIGASLAPLIAPVAVIAVVLIVGTIGLKAMVD